ncbi:substrate-binding domain-containing protein [Klebsiella pneumoniae]|nr:substrate-binding domain-containing protein [Klebsiella pneumoniae]
MRHAIQGWATRWPGGRSSWSAAEDSLSVPPGEIAGAWLIRQNLADLFIGYAHYGPALAACDDLRTLTIPAPWNIRCDYQLARLRADPAALALYRFILGDVGQGYLRQAGFMPFSDAA